MSERIFLSTLRIRGTGRRRIAISLDIGVCLLILWVQNTISLLLDRFIHLSLARSWPPTCPAAAISWALNYRSWIFCSIRGLFAANVRQAMNADWHRRHTPLLMLSEKNQKHLSQTSLLVICINALNQWTGLACWQNVTPTRGRGRALQHSNSLGGIAGVRSLSIDINMLHLRFSAKHRPTQQLMRQNLACCQEDMPRMVAPTPELFMFFPGMLYIFPECVARVPVSLGGLGVRLCSPSFAFVFATVGNRPQPFATVGNHLSVRRKALHSGERVWRGPETVSHWLLLPQLHWCLQRRCLWECSVAPQLYWSLQRRCLCEWSLSPQLYWCLQRTCLWEWSVAPQLYWCLQRRCLWEWSVSPQLYCSLQRTCPWEWSVSPQLHWCLQRRCLREWSVSPQFYWCL